MEVQKIISYSEWIPGRHYGQGKPKVSVLLPTYCRGKSGMFFQAATSVLGQTLRDLELIIVDDASTDGTAEQIAGLMQKDGRVSLIRHPRNVGLPAISVYEAFLKARGEYIAFAFDDTKFHATAIKELASYLDRGLDFIYGYVKMAVYEEITGQKSTHLLGFGEVPQATLHSHNYIPNNAVMFHRQIINNVGWYDPHICLARLCDWDLWRRIEKEYNINSVDVEVGWEYGPSTTDSLGKTRMVDLWVANEWMKISRNDQLKPNAYLYYDVLALPDDLSIWSRYAIREMQTQYRDKFWYRSVYSVTSRLAQDNQVDEAGDILVVCPGIDASVTLYFEYLPENLQRRIRFVEYSAWMPCPDEMVKAAAIIFVRDLFNCHWIAIAQKLNIPCYYFIDDNFQVLREDGYKEYIDYTVINVKQRLKHFSGVLLSTKKLLDFYRNNNLHYNLFYYPPIAKNIIETDERTGKKEAIKIGFLGGLHRSESFYEIVLPAIIKLSQRYKIILYMPVGGENKKIEKQPGLEVVGVPRNLSYDLVIRNFRKFNIDILVHINSFTKNNLYKTKNVLINAMLLEAIPILSKVEPYKELEGAEVALLCNHTIDAWYEALLKVAAGKVDRTLMYKRLAEYCKQHYSGEQNCNVIRKILESHPVPGLVLIGSRYKALYKMADAARIPTASRTIGSYIKEAIFLAREGKISVLGKKAINFVRKRVKI